MQRCDHIEENVFFFKKRKQQESMCECEETTAVTSRGGETTKAIFKIKKYTFWMQNVPYLTRRKVFYTKSLLISQLNVKQHLSLGNAASW